MHLITALILLVGTAAFGGPSLPETEPMKKCSFSTLAAAPVVDRSQIILEAGVQAVDTTSLQPIRKGRITDTFTGAITTDTGDVKPVIIKKTSDTQKAIAPNADPLLHEYRILKELNDSVDPQAKYFPRVLALGPEFLAIEYFESKTLAQVYRERSLTQERAQKIQKQLEEAVDALNTAGISHGDIKPTNILVLPDDTIKLIDFGVAVRKGEHHVSTGSHGFNSEAQKAAGGGDSDRSRAVPVLDNAAGYDGVLRTIRLNITQPQTAYVDILTSPFQPQPPPEPPSSPQ